VTKWPEIRAENMVEDSYIIQAVIPKNLLYFDGHFADNPVLPGVVQVNWASVMGRRAFSISGTFKQLEVIKFQQLFFPLDEITITLKYDEIKRKLSFSYGSERGVHASGRICFE